MPRKRGRPFGTTKDDTATLRAIADLIIRKPDLKPTSAIRHLTKDCIPCPVRRLQTKWKNDRENLLAEARVRFDAERELQLSNSANLPIEARALDAIRIYRDRHACDAILRTSPLFMRLDAICNAASMSTLMHKFPEPSTLACVERITAASRAIDSRLAPMFKMIEAAKMIPTFKMIEAAKMNPMFKVIEAAQNNPMLTVIESLNARFDARKWNTIGASVGRALGN